MLMLFSWTWPHGSICNGYLLFNKRIIFKKLKFSFLKKKNGVLILFLTDNDVWAYGKGSQIKTATQWAPLHSQFPKLLIISKPKKKALRYPHRKTSNFNRTLSLRKRLEYWAQIVKICSVIRLCAPFNCTFEHYSSYLSHHYTNKLTIFATIIFNVDFLKE